MERHLCRLPCMHGALVTARGVGSARRTAHRAELALVAAAAVEACVGAASWSRGSIAGRRASASSGWADMARRATVAAGVGSIVAGDAAVAVCCDGDVACSFRDACVRLCHHLCCHLCRHLWSRASRGLCHRNLRPLRCHRSRHNHRRHAWGRRGS